MFSSNKWNKKEGSPSSFWRKLQLISLNSSVFIENLPSFERARACARANHAKIDAQKGCAMQLNGITLREVHFCNQEAVVLSRQDLCLPSDNFLAEVVCNGSLDWAFFPVIRS